MPVSRGRVRRHGGARPRRSLPGAPGGYVLRDVAPRGAGRLAGAARPRSGRSTSHRTGERGRRRPREGSSRRRARVVSRVQGARGPALVPVAWVQGARQGCRRILPPRRVRRQRGRRRHSWRRRLDLGRVQRIVADRGQAPRRGVHRSALPGARRPRVAQAGARGCGRGDRREGAHRLGAPSSASGQASPLGRANARGARRVRVLRHQPGPGARARNLRAAVALEAGHHTGDVRPHAKADWRRTSGGRRD
mmetsp:Transcript_7981/g.35275  ORF Transcript_7981/g.35275 Transcript_7981/m.35275 type:complete len:250 (+) Transcript_7981:3163-3912(+)